MRLVAWAHPRSRGENPLEETHAAMRVGSSPLTRGKHAGRNAAAVGPGLIPAHAGKTDALERRQGLHEAHPRSRGENQTDGLVVTPREGSSPLTRGKHGPGPARYRSRGLIPAHAGKTKARAYQARVWWAHPRSRGENPDCGVRVFLSEGSSPLTRGKRGSAPATRVGDRLIPAHAGKTPSRQATTPISTAHPRSRGENGEYEYVDDVD